VFDVVTQRLALLGQTRARVMRPAEAEPAGRSTVSVVVPCYNYGHFLPSCVASILEQPGVDVDVLIIDDASPDGSGEVASSLAAGDRRISVIRHEQNRGHIATYNEGLSQIKGDYAVLLSADDLLTPGALSRAVALMEAHPSVGLVYGSAINFSTETPPPARTEVTNWTVWRGGDWLAGRCRMGRNVIKCPEVVMRTDVLRAVGEYRADLPHGADFELWMRTAAVADIGRVGGVDQAYYRIHGENMSRTTYDVDRVGGLVRDLQERRKCFEGALNGADHPAGDSSLLDRARRALAVQALTVAVRPYVWGVADRWPVEELQAFAEETYPDTHRLALWRALERRQRVGVRRSRRNPLFVPTELVHRMQEAAELWRWRHAGV
jgi:hypothetical protein